MRRRGPSQRLDLEATALAARHATLYDGLALEYAKRAESVIDVTRASIARLMSTSPPSRGAVLDVGCGAGVVSQVLSEHGYDVTAIDVAPTMAAVCAARVPSAHVLPGDYLATPFLPRFVAIVAFAFIHLFPRSLACRCLVKMRRELAVDGRLLIGTTAEPTSREGLEQKVDYPGAPARYRRRWSEQDFLAALGEAGFGVLDVHRHRDPFGKVWLDAVAAPRCGKSAWTANPIAS